jgi:hypothetical protein
MKNIKDMFEKVNFRHGRGTNCEENQVAMTVSKAKKDHRISIGITIGRDIMAAMRWVVGDRITIDFDCEHSKILLRRVPNKSSDVASWALSPSAAKAKSKAGSGCIRTQLRLTATPVMLKAFGVEDLEGVYIPTDTTTSESGISFSLRKQWTVYQ